MPADWEMYVERTYPGLTSFIKSRTENELLGSLEKRYRILYNPTRIISYD